MHCINKLDHANCLIRGKNPLNSAWFVKELTLKITVDLFLNCV